MLKPRHLRLLLAGLTGALVVLGLSPAGASSANISHSYHADGHIVSGSLVSLDPERTDYVLPANADNGSQLLGVAVTSGDSLVAVGSVNSPSDSLQVATSGSATVLVSDINGSINVGDQISVSPFDGVGMKAAAGSHVIGLAQTAFNANSANAATQQVTDKNGVSKQIRLGYIDLGIAIGTDTNNNLSDGPQVNGLQKLAQSITGHTVSTTRVIISLIVAIVALLSLVAVIYASIYGSIVSIGRNPLAKYVVFRTLGSVLAMAVLTSLVAAVTIFLLLH